MSTLVLLTNAPQPSAEVLPALTLLPHTVKVLPAEASALVHSPRCDAVLVDGRRDLAQAREFTRLLRTTGTDVPLILVVGEGGLAVVTADWGADDVLLDTAGPVEVDARLRLVAGRLNAAKDEPEDDVRVIRSGSVVIEEATYTARLDGRVLDLTFKEFELLKHLAQHPGRVFTRNQLLQEVWGYDYFGGTRTVDVHVRRLRAKLGPEHEALIGTMRNVGYRFVLPPSDASAGAPTTAGEDEGDREDEGDAAEGDAPTEAAARDRSS
jgi:DNA-binding response OmpR family regulator